MRGLNIRNQKKVDPIKKPKPFGPQAQVPDRFYVKRADRAISPSRTDVIPIENQRGKHMKQPVYGLKNPQDLSVDFQSLVTSKASQEFLDHNNSSITRSRLAKQANLSPKQVDNMIIKGLKARKEVKYPGDGKDNLTRGANAQSVTYNRKPHSDVDLSGKEVKGEGTVRTYGLGEDVVRFNSSSSKDAPVEFHERTHASGLDAAMGKSITDVIGSPWKQKKEQTTRIKKYMTQPSEAYSNFVEMRSRLKMKPGDQIDEKTLIKKMKKVEADNGRDHFYGTYDNDKIVKALNTIASNVKKPKNNNRVS